MDPQQRFHARLELAEINGLRDVIVSTRIEPLYHVVGGIERGLQDHGNKGQRAIAFDTAHDFQNQNGAVEAKLTTSNAPERLRITSERQLDESVVPWLALFGVIAQEAESGPVSVSTLVDQLRAAVQACLPSTMVLFEERLTDSGYSDTDRNHYHVKLFVHADSFFHVTGDFPRIRHDDIRSGVFNVGYDVPWSAVVPYRISNDDVRRVFGA